MLRLADPGATSLLLDASAQADTLEIWLSLAAAHLQAGNRPAARAALARLLAQHVLPADTRIVARLATRACQDSDIHSWCGVARSPDGASLHWIAGCDGATASLDGKMLRGPKLPERDGTLSVQHDGSALLGSPISLAHLRRVEGFVQSSDDGGLEGWAWLPADAETHPWLSVTAPNTKIMLRVQASDGTITAPRPLTRPRRFTIAATELAALPGLLRVFGEDGRPLAGSPLDPAELTRAAALAAPAALKGAAAAAVACADRPVAVVIPAYRDHDKTMACLNSVFAAEPSPHIIVIDDASPEPDLAAALQALAAAGRITLIRHSRNQGFPASANAGLRAALALKPPHDALLLNSDTLVPTQRGASWLTRLRAAVHGAPDIGTATPLSNDATILSYPHRDSANQVPNQREVSRIDAVAARANAGRVADIPTAVGFCMYVRHECAIDTGLFHPSLFAQGYGEENDFCIRARHLGWRHVAVPGVFVGHSSGASFGAMRSPLIARNLAVLERLHPGYHALIAEYQGAIPAHDALAPARRRMDMLRWTAGKRKAAVLLVTHASGGGVERVVRKRVAEIIAADMRPVVLRPVLDPQSEGGSVPGLCRVDDSADGMGFPNLVFDLRSERPALARLLRADRPVVLEVHHRLGHHTAITDLAALLAVPTEFHLHDYACFCPRITLLNPERRYCGEPTEIARCEACVADAGSRIEEKIGIGALRARSALAFAGAQRVVVPSADMATRIRRHFPMVRAQIAPHEADPARLPPPPLASQTMRVCVIGAIGVEKGFDILLACAHDAAARALPLEFVLVGHSTDDQRLFATGRVVVTGRYQEADGPALVRAQAAHLAFLPSLWPETWGFTLGLAWRAGLRAAVFDVGAMAARVRATGHGMVLPLGLPAAGINQALLNSRNGIPAEVKNVMF